MDGTGEFIQDRMLAERKDNPGENAKWVAAGGKGRI